MKLYGALLALTAVCGTSAFTAKGPQPKTFALHSTIGETASASPAQAGLDARLAALENGRRATQTASPASSNSAQEVWETSTPITVQGGSLKTWSFLSSSVERVQVVMKTEGRPLEADIDLWQGPDNTPQKMRVYVEDGSERPFSAVVETPRGTPNTIAIRNTANMEFPLAACVAATTDAVVGQTLSEAPMIIQGGALRTYAFEPLVESVQVLLKTDGRPLNARIELLQGPNNNKQVVELYTEDGLERPFYAVIETPGSGNVVRVVNTATVEFPMTAWVEPYTIGDKALEFEPVIGGDQTGAWMSGARW